MCINKDDIGNQKMIVKKYMFWMKIEIDEKLHCEGKLWKFTSAFKSAFFADYR